MAARKKPAAGGESPEAQGQAAEGREECQRHEPARAEVLSEARLGFRTWKLYRVACSRCGKDMGTETELG